VNILGEIGWNKGVAKRNPKGPATPIEMLFQNFRLNFSWNVTKMHCFSNKFKKSSSTVWALRSKRPLTFNIGDLKLRDVAKLWIFKLIIKKSNFKKISYDIILVTSLSLRHRQISPK